MYHLQGKKMNERQPKESIMGTAEVSRLVLTTGIPLMLSLLINSLYNFVDSVFVSRVAADARYDHHHAAPGCPSGYSGARASPGREAYPDPDGFCDRRRGLYSGGGVVLEERYTKGPSPCVWLRQRTVPCRYPLFYRLRQISCYSRKTTHKGQDYGIIFVIILKKPLPDFQ